MTLLSVTEQLINQLDQLKDQFYTEKSNEDDHQFFQQVKAETDVIFQTLNQWEESTLSYIKEVKSVVHMKQVVATKENIELLIIHSYYKDMRKRRYMEYYNSSLYVLQQLERELENG